MATSYARRQALTILGLVVLYAWSVARTTKPPAPVPATAPDTVFSAERAVRHVGVIAQRPHALGSPDHARVRDYLLAQLTALGLHPEVQSTTAIGTRYRAAGHVENIVATLPGRVPNSRALLVVAHYDGVGAGPAASDDGAGVAAMLETLRALRARKTPLAHDVIFLITDGEESGLLGAAAFVREHPLAKTVAFILNFEARGTSGRSFMFETGDGNLDAVRQLRAAPDVTVGSVSTTVYRTLPNDTDLSELAMLGLPALNFAFAQGVERYHTSRDDSTHLNPGSLQHHGMQMLAMTKRLADGDLPRPKTGDGVFFDMPLIGIVVYPMWIALPLALVALVLTVIVVRPMWRASLIGAVVMLLSLGIVALIARSINLAGPARWSGLYAIAIVLGAAGINVVIYGFAKRWKPEIWSGAFVIWLILSLVTSAWLPSVSYPFTWPLLFALIAARSRHPVARWLAVAITVLILGGLSYLAAAVMLGLAGIGAIALAVLTSLMTWLLLPTIEQAIPPVRGGAALLFFAPAALLVAIALGVATPSPEHPTPTSLLYAENTQYDDAWLGTVARPDDWTRMVLRTLDPSPGWVSLLGNRLLGHSVPRASIEAPTATLASDSTVGGERRLMIRVHAPSGATAVVMRASGARVMATTLDGRRVDTARFRLKSPTWIFQYWAVPDSGALIGLTVAAGSEVDFDIASRRPGLPTIAGLTIPPRPADVVPAQDGDVSVVYRHSRF